MAPPSISKPVTASSSRKPENTNVARASNGDACNNGPEASSSNTAAADTVENETSAIAVGPAGANVVVDKGKGKAKAADVASTSSPSGVRRSSAWAAVPIPMFGSLLKPPMKSLDPSNPLLTRDALKAPTTLMGELNLNSIADVDTPLIVRTPVAGLESESDEGRAARLIGKFTSTLKPSPVARFSTDPTLDEQKGHYLAIHSLAIQDYTCSPLADFVKQHHDSIIGQKLYHHQENSSFSWYLYFDDLRDSTAVKNSLNRNFITCRAEVCRPQEYYSIENEGTAVPDFFEGQVLMTAVFNGDREVFDDINQDHFMKHFAEKVGTPKDNVVAGAPDGCAVHHLTKLCEDPAMNTLVYRVEFNKISDAQRAVELGSFSFPQVGSHWQLTFEPFACKPKYDTPPPSRQDADGTKHYNSPTGRTAWTEDLRGMEKMRTGPNKVPKVQHPTAPAGASRHISVPNQMPSYRRNSSMVDVIDTRSMSCPVNFDNTFEPIESMEPVIATYPNAHYGSGRARDDIDGPQRIDPWKVADGTDVRTTVMLRNLPNEWTWENLKTLLDMVAPGNYDFTYLRVDFTNGNNVGYGFVNFTEPRLILEFYTRVMGKPWPWQKIGTPCKMADLTYATFQGVDCLIEKFRNSCIMDEAPSCRPKLWYTYMSYDCPSLAGIEKPFPPPNNLSKKQRSRDNAASIGLYSPSARRNGRGRYGQGRRSTFDRGTPAQLREEAYYEAANGDGHGYSNGNGHDNGAGHGNRHSNGNDNNPLQGNGHNGAGPSNTMGHHMGHNGAGPGNAMGYRMGHHMGHNGAGPSSAMGHHMGQRGTGPSNVMGHHMGHHMGQNMGYNIGHNVGQSMGNNVGQNMGNNVGQNMGNNMGNNMSNNVGHNTGHGTGHHAGHNAGNSIGQNMGQNTRQGNGQGHSARHRNGRINGNGSGTTDENANANGNAKGNSNGNGPVGRGRPRGHDSFGGWQWPAQPRFPPGGSGQ